MFMLCACSQVRQQSIVPGEDVLPLVPGFPQDIRVWADAPAGPLLSAISGEGLRPVSDGRPRQLLALSGGGENGAYGAGFLVGWSRRGDRPDFTIVTGVSAGALVAPFAFLGPACDDALTEIFTSIGRSDVLSVELGGLLFGTSLASTAPLEKLIEAYVTPELLGAVAAEHEAGRRLLVVTTNLDAQRPVLWNMGAIASTGGPAAERLFERVLLASASIPVIFPPVLLEARSDGRSLQEMHVDGGAMLQIFAAPPAFFLADSEDVPPPGSTVTMIVNDRLEPRYELTDLSAPDIARRSFAAVVTANTRLNVAGTYRFAQDNGIDFALTFIGNDFEEVEAPAFDAAVL